VSCKPEACFWVWGILRRKVRCLLSKCLFYKCHVESCSYLRSVSEFEVYWEVKWDVFNINAVFPNVFYPRVIFLPEACFWVWGRSRSKVRWQAWLEKGTGHSWRSRCKLSWKIPSWNCWENKRKLLFLKNKIKLEINYTC
jgi:hypothetical protein